MNERSNSNKLRLTSRFVVVPVLPSSSRDPSSATNDIPKDGSAHTPKGRLRKQQRSESLGDLWRGSKDSLGTERKSQVMTSSPSKRWEELAQDRLARRTL